jgi:hypothetical protein
MDDLCQSVWCFMFNLDQLPDDGGHALLMDIAGWLGALLGSL